jgi:hypothetical protein
MHKPADRTKTPKSGSPIANTDWAPCSTTTRAIFPGSSTGHPRNSWPKKRLAQARSGDPVVEKPPLNTAACVILVLREKGTT